MNLSDSIKTCFSKSIVISGRASRSEFWWFQFFRTIVWLIPVVGWVVAIFTILPSITVTIRRLHDTNHSGFFLLPMLLLPFLPFVLFAPPLNSPDMMGMGHGMNMMDYVFHHGGFFFFSNVTVDNFGPAAVLVGMVCALYSLMLLLWLVKGGDKRINHYGAPQN